MHSRESEKKMIELNEELILLRN